MSKPDRESTVEDYLIGRCDALGFLTRKVTWIGRNKAPDRVILAWPDRTVWVEVKSEVKGPKFPSNAHEDAQAREHVRMRGYGADVRVIWTKPQVDALMRELGT